MIREMKERPTELGRELREIYDRGDLVDDEMMIRLIRDRLDRGDTLPGFVLDGFPRTLVQAEALDDLMSELDRPIDVVFEFQVPNRQQLIERLKKRAVEENRSDDTPEAMQRRLDLYETETAPLVEFYRSTRGNVVGIHADRAIEDVFHEIATSLDQVQARA
jgi:adenylate kinase